LLSETKYKTNPATVTGLDELLVVQTHRRIAVYTP